MNISNEGHLPTELYDPKSKHMVIEVQINGKPAKALVDQQTTRANLISSSYVTTYNLPTIALLDDITIQMSLQGSRGKSTHYVQANLNIVGYEIPVCFCVAALSEWDIILGEPLLRHLKSIIDIANQSMTIRPVTSQQFPRIEAIKSTSKRRQISSHIVTSAQNTMWTSEDDITNDATTNKNDNTSTEPHYIMSDDDPADQPTSAKPYSYEQGVIN